MEYLSKANILMIYTCITLIIISCIRTFLLRINLYQTIKTAAKNLNIPLQQVIRMSNLISNGSFIIIGVQLFGSILMPIICIFTLPKQVAIGVAFGFIITVTLVLSCIYICNIGNILVTLKCANSDERYNDSLKNGLKTAYNAGGIAGIFLLTSFASIITIYFIYKDKFVLIGMAIGSTLVSTFIKISGGVFTKAADIGADLSGKLDLDLKEDDPSNPMAIADNMGDCIGDMAGASTCILSTLICSFMSAILWFNYTKQDVNFILLMIISSGLAYIAAFYLVKSIGIKKSINGKTVMHKMHMLIFLSGLISLILYIFLSIFYIEFLQSHENYDASYHKISLYRNTIFPGISFAFGIISTLLVIFITNANTEVDSYIVQSMIESVKKYGISMTLISAHSNSFFAVFQICSVTIIGVLCPLFLQFQIRDYLALDMSIDILTPAISFLFAQIGLAFAIITVDIFGPISDNAGGIAALSNCDEPTRMKTDTLDEAGNATKALTKSYTTSIIIVNSIILLSYINIINNNALVYGYSFVISAIIGSITVTLCMGCLINWVYMLAEDSCKFVKKIFNQYDNANQSSKDDAFYTQTFFEMGKQSTFIAIFGFGILLFPFLLIKIISTVIVQQFYIDPEKELYIDTETMHALIYNNMMFAICIGALIAAIIFSISMTIFGGALDNVKKGSKADIPSEEVFIQEIKHLITNQASFEMINNEIQKLIKAKSMKEAVVHADMCGDPFKDTAGPVASAIPKLYIVLFCCMIELYTESITNNRTDVMTNFNDFSKDGKYLED